MWMGNNGKGVPRVILQHLPCSPGWILLQSDGALPGISDKASAFVTKDS